MQYEMVVVVDPEVEEKQAKEKLTTLLEKEGFQVSVVEKLGKKLLAYPIKNRTEGLYFLLQLVSDTANPNVLAPKMKQDESILRYLVLRKEVEKQKPSTQQTQDKKSEIPNPN